MACLRRFRSISRSIWLVAASRKICTFGMRGIRPAKNPGHAETLATALYLRLPQISPAGGQSRRGSRYGRAGGSGPTLSRVGCSRGTDLFPSSRREDLDAVAEPRG